MAFYIQGSIQFVIVIHTVLELKSIGTKDCRKFVLFYPRELAVNFKYRLR